VQLRSITLLVAIAATTYALPSPTDVVPENILLVDDAAEPSPSTLSQSLIELRQGVHNERQKSDVARVSKLAHTVETMLSSAAPATPTDGGTAALASRVATAKQAVKTAITTMSDGLVSEYDQGIKDLQTLKDSIDAAVQDVSADEQDHLKTAAHKSCTAEEAAKLARETVTTTTNDRNNYDPTIPTNLAFFKELGSITQCNRDSASAQCPDPTVSVSAALLDKFKAVTQTYHGKDVAMKNAEEAKQTAEATASTELTALTTRVSTLVEGLVDFCKNDGDIYNGAVDEFNANNAHRGSMLHTLHKLVCTMDHIDNSAGNAIAVDNSASAGATATSEADCHVLLKSKATLQSEKFAAVTKQDFTCPSQATYVQTVKDVHNMQLTSTWTATPDNCVAVADAMATDAPTDSPTEAPTDSPTEAPTDSPTEAPTEAPNADITQPPKDIKLLADTSTDIGRKRHWNGMAVSSDGNLIFATESDHGKKGGVWTSVNGGDTFSEVTALKQLADEQPKALPNHATAEYDGMSSYFRDVAGSTDLKVVVVLNHERMFISKNYGVDWSVAPSVVGRQGTHVHSGSYSLERVVVSSTGNEIYASAYQYGLWRSTDGGASFELVKEGAKADGTDFQDGWFDKVHGTSADGKVVIAIAADLWISEDYGKAGTWEKRSPNVKDFVVVGNPYEYHVDAAISADGDRIVVAGRANMVYTSKDRGHTWHGTQVDHYANEVDFCGDNTDNLVLGSYWDLGVATSSNFGDDWSGVPSTGQLVHSAFRCPSDASKLICAVGSKKAGNKLLTQDGNSGFLYALEY
jgi:hypothetical protein